VTGDPQTCSDSDPNCNCPDSDPYCVTRGSCPVSDPNCCCPWYNPDCVTADGQSCGGGGEYGWDGFGDLNRNIGSINSIINNYLSVSASVRPSGTRSNGVPEIPAAGGSVAPPGLTEEKHGNRTRDNHNIITDENSWMTTLEYFYDTSDNVLSRSSCSSNSSGTYEVCFDGSNEDFFDWRARSSDLNVLFFNPEAPYIPWVGYDDANFSSARSQPVSSNSGYSDTRNMDGFFYHYWLDDKGFVGSQPNWNNVTDTGNGIIDQWDSHVKVTVSSGGFSCDLFTYSPTSAGLNLQITPMLSNDPLCVEALGINPSLAALQQNVANWYQYYRKRILVAKAAVSGVVFNQPDFRYGLSMINNTSDFVEMPSASTTEYSAHNAQLITT
jgi:hypothetical protein